MEEEDPLAYHMSVLKLESWYRMARQAGQPRLAIHTRQQLQREFANQQAFPYSLGERYIPAPVTGETYPPCQSPLAELTKISLKDLICETRHHGSYLLLRTICQPLRKSAILAAVEDEFEDVDRLAIYHANNTLPAAEILPEGTVLAIKEPFYNMKDERFAIHIDHPSDMVVLEHHHHEYPDGWKVSYKEKRTALEWSREGEDALAREAYLEAHRCFTRGLACADSLDVESKRDVFRSRSLANFHLGRYDATISDAFFSLSNDKDDDQFKQKNAHAHHQRGLANYQLRHYNDAQRCFEQALELSPLDEPSKRELQRTKLRVMEQNEGAYDFAQIQGEVEKNGSIADRASFTSKTEVRDTPDRGQGLFATEDICMGDLVLCEKAFMVTHTKETSTSRPFSTVWRDIVRKVIDNPSQSKELFGLYAGGPRSFATSVLIVDGNPVVDVFKVAKLLKLNGFSYTVGRASLAYGTSGMVTDDDPRSTGLWVHVSNANHACLANTIRSFVGDLIVLRAARDISKGEELTLSYQNPLPLVEERQRALFEAWGFRCDCPLCQMEERLGASIQNPIADSMGYLESCPINSNIRISRELVQMAELLASDLEEAYAGNISLHLPCLGMMHIWSWLCQIYFLLGTKIQTERCAKKILLSCGYRLEINGTEVNLGGEHGLPGVAVVDALFYLAHVYEEDGKKALGQNLEELAKEVYEIVNGTGIGFEEKYCKE